MNRTFRLIIRYDGTGYAGWQIQPGHKTIQGVLEEALNIILNEPCRLTAAGRTDAGVHALGQVAHFKTGSKIPGSNLKMALNSVLPKDISIMDAFDAHPDFHARKQALAKRYIYRISRGQVRDPFQWPYTWFLPDKLDIARIKACLPILKGEHDFSAFSVVKKDHMNGVRRLMKVEMAENKEQLQFEFLGNGFLRKQVRRMVGTLIDVGRGRFTPHQFNRILLSGDPAQAGPTAPAKGLFLVKVYYPNPSICDF